VSDGREVVSIHVLKEIAMKESRPMGVLIDCGRVSRRTRGMPIAPLTEAGAPPFIHFAW